MEKVPRFVSILGLRYSVMECELIGMDGCINPGQQRIVISDSLSREKKIQTYLHELVHGIFEQLGYNDLYEDERLTQGMAIGLYEALKEDE